MIQIQIWHATSSQSHPGPIEEHCEAFLDDQERERADRFRQPTSRNQNIIGRAMARCLVGQQTGVDPKQIQFDSEVLGKPFVCDPPDAKLPFNVAHTHGLVVCGAPLKRDAPLNRGEPVKRGEPMKTGAINTGQVMPEPDANTADSANAVSILLGVDVEGIDRRTDPAIADRFFSKPEVDYLNTQCGSANRQKTFLKIWTLKEAFIKAIGTGMTTPLGDFAFEDVDSDRPRIRLLSDKLDRDLNWQFRSFEPRPGFVAAVAVAKRPSSIQSSNFEFDITLKDFDQMIDG